jgi:hypothetical protein
MRLWIAEECDGKALFRARAKHDVLKQIRHAHETVDAIRKDRYYRWNLWLIDPNWNYEFLLSVVRDDFSFRDIDRVEGSFEWFYTKGGKKTTPCVQAKGGDHKNPYPSDWSI